MSSTSKSISEHRIFVLSALERIENGEMATVILKDAPQQYLALCQEMIYGIQRWKGSLEKMIQLNVRKRPKLWTRRLLSMALYELYFLKRPPHAVINEAVELCNQSKFKKQSKFVNAFLRQAKLPENVYANDNFPPWLMDLWSQDGRWLKSLQVPPKSGVVFFDRAIPDTYQSIVERPCTINTEPVRGVVYSNQTGPVSGWQGYNEGDWWIMNPAAAYVVDVAVSHVVFKDSFRALDMCAAPGGKSFRLKSYGAEVTSMDMSSARLSRLEENAARLCLDINIIQHDGTKYDDSFGEFDLVLLDAPCSGLGVVRKHPEARWNRTITDVRSNAILQRKLLSCASQYVTGQGVLAYCVCSLHPVEGVEIINAFVETNPEWTVVQEWRTPIGSKSAMTELLDGFQLFVLKRNSQKISSKN